MKFLIQNKLRLFILGFVLVIDLLVAASPASPTSLRVNYSPSPVVVDTPRPLFSWQVNDSDLGEKQTAYQILIASSEKRCVEGSADFWDSGKVVSNAQNDIAYGGGPLVSRNGCWWKVKTWDKEGNSSGWSAPAYFEMAFLQVTDWKANWIGGNYERYRTEAPLPKGKEIVKARAYISAKEIFDLNINGVRVGGNRVMEPGESVFVARMRYCTYDVTSHLKEGTNVIGVAIGRGRIGHWWLEAKDREFILQIEVLYKDGTQSQILSDKGTWKATVTGPLIPLPPKKSELFQGETYDARREDGWLTVGYDDHAWTVIDVASPVSARGRLVAQTAPPMKARALMTAKSISQPWPGVYVFDFGQNFSGWSRLSVSGTKGTVLTLRHGNRLYTPRSWADYKFSLNAKIIQGSAGMRFRIADDQNFYLLRLRAGGAAELSKTVKGQRITLKEFPLGLELNKTYPLMIEAAGSTLSLSIHGKLIGSVQDNSFNSGKVGFFQPGNDTAAFDRIFVETNSGFDLSRCSKYSLEDGCKDEGFWLNRDHLKILKLPKDKETDKREPRQFVLTNNETMKSYDGGLLGQVDQSDLHLFNSTYFADSTERYTMKGEGKESWEPRFTLHGFRYVEVHGYPGVPTVESVQARPAYGAIDEDPSTFSCSKELLNKLHQAFVWTFKSSAQFGYVCDFERDERTGWVANNSLGEIYNFDMLNLYDSWLIDYQDTQERLPDGRISRVAPTQDIEGSMKHAQSTVWNASYLTQPWDIYMAYGSKAFLEKRYLSMKRFTDFMRTYQVVDYIDSKGNLSNWATQSLKPKTAYIVDLKLGGTAALYNCVKIMSQMAKELGYREDAAFYEGEAEKIKKAFNKKYLSENKTYIGDKPKHDKTTQTALAVALDFGLCQEEARANVVKTLVENIRENGMHLTTGVFGTRSLLPALCENGEEETAYALATQTTFPSWGKWIVDGLTTVCEHWNGQASTGIYYITGPLDAYFYKYLAGIRMGKPGYEEFSIKPCVKNDLEHVSATVNSIRGKIKSHWVRHQGGESILDISIPVNSVATVYIPTFGQSLEKCTIWEGGKVIWKEAKPIKEGLGATIIGTEKEYLICRLGSGDYQFKVEKKTNE